MKMEMLFFLYFILTQLMFTTISQPDFFFHECSIKGNYTKDSIFEKNLDKVLSLISSDTQIDYGFYNFSVGEDPNKVSAMALCRVATPLDVCRSCINNSTRRIKQDCPNQKEAMGWYPSCQFRYSNNSIFGVADSSSKTFLCNVQKASDANGFNQALRSLLDELRIEAASGTSIRKFATGSKPVPQPSFDTIYAYVECTPDLSSFDCNNCLITLIRSIPDYCNASIGAARVAPSCLLNFEIHPLYSQLPSPPPSPAIKFRSPPPPPTEGNDSKTIRRAKVIGVSTIFALMLMITICIFMFLRMRKLKHKMALEKVEDEISSIEMLQYDFDTMKLATDEFSSENKLGRGGFGAVYKGKLPNGQNIAVKRLAKDSQQGEAEFRNEVLLVAKLRHRNLVSLLGFCLERNERLLIYEFVPNGSLDRILFDPLKRIVLNWIRRYKIIIGIARGLLYLHEDSQFRIIHRDLKASNILLDEEMNSKIADFGMAKLFELEETRGQTRRIVGTYGYMAPEYAMHGRFSIKSDMFSFGILVFEILTGQKINDFHVGEEPTDLLTFAWNKWREGNCRDLIDSALGLESSSRSEMMKCIHIGLLCVQENVEARPTIASVVVALISNSISLPLPSKPAFFMHSGVHASGSTTTPSTHSNLSQNQASISDLFPR